MADFKKCVEFVLRKEIEGGYSNNPKDPGKETNFGISKRWHPDVDIKNLTKEQALEIYRREYWIPCGAEELDSKMGLVVFDTSVNCGIVKARKFLKECGGDVYMYLDLRKQYYLDIIKRKPDQITFKNGWLRRLDLISDELKKI